MALTDGRRVTGLARLPHSLTRSRTVLALVFLSPWILSLFVFDVVPFLGTFLLSASDYSVGRVIPHWVGLENYKEMLHSDDLFLLSVKNTLYYIALSVPLTIALAFVIAVLLNTNIRGKSLYRIIYYIPSVVPIVASSALWLWIFHSKYGLLNMILYALGGNAVPWLTSPDVAKNALILMSLWGFGTQMIIFLAGLQSIPDELYQAAAMDGAGAWQNFRYISIPMMTPIIFFNLVLGIISSFQVFTTAYVMTQGGPMNATLFYMLHIYNTAFRHFRMGYASALAVFLFLMILALTLVLNRTSERWVFYTEG